MRFLVKARKHVISPNPLIPFQIYFSKKWRVYPVHPVILVLGSQIMFWLRTENREPTTDLQDVTLTHQEIAFQA